MSMINWFANRPLAMGPDMDMPLSSLPPMPEGRLPRTVIRARLREIAALRRSERRL
jgi:hypothetical protein